MKKAVALIPLLLVLFINQSYSSESVNTTESTEEVKELVSIKKGSFVSAVKLVGDIEAKKQVYLAPPFSAKVEKLADDGDKIKKGSLIAKLESKEQQDELSETELESVASKNDLMQMGKDSIAEIIKLNSNILLAEKNLELKKLELKKLINQPTPEELKKLNLNIQLAKKSLAVANSDLEQKNKLVTKGVLQRKDILEQKLTVAKKEKDYNTALAEYQLTKAGATPNSKAIAQLEIEKAENSLSIEKQNLILRKQQITLEKSKVNVKVNVTQKRVDQLKSEIADSVIKSPADGTVVISKIWGDKGLEKVKVGDTLQKGRPFVSIANLDDIIIKAQIEEQFIGKVKLGQKCNISTSNLKGKIFPGKINKIGLLASEKQGEKYVEGSSKVFEIYIALDKTSNIFKPGMSVDIEIVMKNLDNILLIPNKAVYKDDSKNFVYMPDGAKKYIKLGLSNTEQSIVESGLSTGEQVVIEKDS